MTNEQLEYFKNLLEIQKLELLESQVTAKEAAKPVELDQSSVGRLSRMDALQQQAVAVESQRRRTIQLQRIESALLRIEEGEYGLCIMCEEEIALKRLKNNPANPLCILCASLQEKR